VKIACLVSVVGCLLLVAMPTRRRVDVVVVAVLVADRSRDRRRSRHCVFLLLLVQRVEAFLVWRPGTVP